MGGVLNITNKSMGDLNDRFPEVVQYCSYYSCSPTLICMCWAQRPCKICSEEDWVFFSLTHTLTHTKCIFKATLSLKGRRGRCSYRRKQHKNQPMFFLLFYSLQKLLQPPNSWPSKLFFSNKFLWIKAVLASNSTLSFTTSKEQKPFTRQKVCLHSLKQMY